VSRPAAPACLRSRVLVVGAGPAGTELARLLAQAGEEVLLVDRLADLRRSAFSSAALPLESVQEFGLPSSVVAAPWRGWQLLGPDGQPRSWWADRPLGAVLEFGALRQWLAGEAAAWGARLRLGWRALGWRAEADAVITELVDAAGARHAVRSDWVVDASGERRVLLGAPHVPADPLLSGVGVEWLLAVDPAGWQTWSEKLSFFLGSRWVQQGYGWVFPMQPGCLKVGVCRLEDPEAGQPPLGLELQRLLQRCGLEHAPVLDRHGGRIRSTVRRRDPHRVGRLVGLGDAVSTANLLGGEGIRHALCSARVLAPLLLEACRRDAVRPLQAYPGRLKAALGWRWPLSGRLARRTWLGLRDAAADRRLEALLRSLQRARAEDLSALLFDYRFERYGLRALPYLLGRR
jgi:flavin-dependent dehydrogenase